jgi:electron transfer flavoprotein alpha/beta subunit
MDIYVCFKASPLFEQVMPEDWKGFSLGADIGYAGKALGCFDEAALELALRIKDSLGGVRLFALTLAPELSDSIACSLHAVGFDDVIRLDADVEFNPKETARLIYGYLKDKSPQAVLCGIQAGYGDSGLVPAILAHFLGIGLMAPVEDITLEGGVFNITVYGDAGRRLAKVNTPFAAAVGNSKAALRLASLKEKLASKKRKAAAIHVEAPVWGGGYRLLEVSSNRKAIKSACKGEKEAAAEILALVGEFSKASNDKEREGAPEGGLTAPNGRSEESARDLGSQRGFKPKLALFASRVPNPQSSIKRLWKMANDLGFRELSLWLAGFSYEDAARSEERRVGKEC